MESQGFWLFLQEQETSPCCKINTHPHATSGQNGGWKASSGMRQMTRGRGGKSETDIPDIQGYQVVALVNRSLRTLNVLHVTLGVGGVEAER